MNKGCHVAKVAFQVLIDEDKAQILQDAADIQGIPAGSLLDNGASPDSIVNDQINQSMWRLRQSGVIPVEIQAEISAFAASKVAERKAAGAAA